MALSRRDRGLQPPLLARVWARRHPGSELLIETAARQDSAACCRFLEHLRPRGRAQPVHVVLDNDPIHRSRQTHAALGAAREWLTVEWLPRSPPSSTTSSARGAI